MIRPADNTGFTLLEMVLAITLSISLLAGLMTLHHHATTVRNQLTAETEMIISERIIMDRMTNELRGTMLYPFLGFGLEGSDEKIQLMTATLPGPAAWAVRKSTDDPIPPETDLMLVGYQLRSYENDDGETVVAGIERSSQKILASPTVREGQEVSTVLLTPHIRFLQFEYFDGEQWTNEWQERGLPMAVKIIMGVVPLTEDIEPEDYIEKYDTFQRVVYVPSGENSRQGPTLRGIGGGGGRR